MSVKNEVIKQIFISHPLGKMKGIPTITTSMLCNPVCAQRSKDTTSICLTAMHSAVSRPTKQPVSAMPITQRSCPLMIWKSMNYLS